MTGLLWPGSCPGQEPFALVWAVLRLDLMLPVKTRPQAPLSDTDSDGCLSASAIFWRSILKSSLLWVWFDKSVSELSGLVMSSLPILTTLLIWLCEIISCIISTWVTHHALSRWWQHLMFTEHFFIASLCISLNSHKNTDKRLLHLVTQ